MPFTRDGDPYPDGADDAANTYSELLAFEANEKSVVWVLDENKPYKLIDGVWLPMNIMGSADMGFDELNDTPAYTGNAGLVPYVNGTVDGLLYSVKTITEIEAAVGDSHAHINKIEVDKITIGDHDIKTNDPHGSASNHEAAFIHSDIALNTTDRHTEAHAITSHSGTLAHSALNDDEAAKHRLINDAGTGLTELWSATKLLAQFNAVNSGYLRRTKVIDYVDCTAIPPTEVADDRYILDFEIGTVHADWDGAAKGDIVEFIGSSWVATTPTEGWVSYVDALNKDILYVDDGTPDWEIRQVALINHNDMQNKQGGAGSEFYHLTNAQHSDVDLNTASRHAESHGITSHTGSLPHSSLNDDESGQHREINDSGTGATELWSANKINNEVVSINDIFTDTSEPTGFANTTDSQISFDDVNRRLTIQPTGISFDYYIKGTKYTKSAAETIDIADTDATHFIYYNGTTLTETTSFSEAILRDYAWVCAVYWNSVSAKSVLINDERHAFLYWKFHKYMHRIFGTQYDTGLSLSNYTIVGDGSLDSDAQCSISDGVIWDEDIEFSINDGSPQELDPIAQIPIIKIEGSIWDIDTATNFPVKQGTSRIQWNKDTAGVWSSIDAQQDYFVAVWIFASLDIVHPVFALLGQREDSTLLAAQENNVYESLNLAGFPSKEGKVLYRLIFQTNSTYANTPAAKLVDVQDNRTLDNVPGGTYVASSHGSLSDRSATNSHPGAAIYLDTTNFDRILSSSDISLQTALETVDDHTHTITGNVDEIVVLNASNIAISSGIVISNVHDPKIWGTKEIDETGIADGLSPVYRSGSGKYKLELIGIPPTVLFADQLENPNSADWAVNALAPLMADSNNAGLKVRKFDDTVEEGIGFTINIPTGATNIKIKLAGRAETAPGTAKTVDWKLYYRGIPDNGAVESWVNSAMSQIDIPINENFQYDEEQKTLASLSITAGRVYQFEITRDVAGIDDLVGDWTLLKIEVEFS